MSNFSTKSISLKDLQSMRVDARYIFAVILLAVLAMEALVIKGELEIASQLQEKAEPVVSKSNTARVNFADYDWAVERIEKAANFQPSGGVAKNPFGAPPQ